MENFGQFLKEHREKQGIRLEEIASITKIQLHNLQCLEANRMEQLPPAPFVLGFITSYAKYIGMDPKVAVDRYRKEFGKPENTTAISDEIVTSELPIPKTEGLKTPTPKVFEQTKEIPIKKIAFALVGILGLFVVTSIIVIGKNASHETAPTPVVETVVTPAPQVVIGPPNPETSKKLESAKEAVAVATNTAPSAVPSIAPPTVPPVAAERSVATTKEKKAEPSVSATPSSTPVTSVTPATPVVDKPVAKEFAHELALDSTDKSWAKIVIDDKPPVEMYTKPGEHTVFQAKEKIKLVLGNASAATVLYNGEKNEGKKYQGTIHFYVFPRGARFPQDPPKQRQVAKEKEAEAIPDLQGTPAESNH